MQISSLQDSTMDRSSLSTLPAELRNRIYTMALRKEAPYSVTHIKLRHLAPEERSPHKHPLSLSTTCKAISLESTPLFYAENEFAISGRSGTDATPEEEVLLLFRQFKETIGPRNAAALHLVKLDAGGIYHTPWSRFRCAEFQDLIRGCHQYLPGTPQCKVVILALFTHIDPNDYRVKGSIAIGLNVANFEQSLLNNISDLSHTMQTHLEPRVATAAEEIGRCLGDLQHLLDVE